MGLVSMSKIPILLVLLPCLLYGFGLAQDDWKWETRNALDAIVYGGSEASLTTELESSMEVGGGYYNNDVSADLTATGVHSAELYSLASLTQDYEDGRVYESRSEIYQTLDLPGEFSVMMSQDHNEDSSSGDENLSAMMAIFGSDDEDLKFMMNSYADGDIDEFLNDALKNDFGLDMTMDELMNLRYGISYNMPETASYKGVTCTWGEAKNTAIELV